MIFLRLEFLKITSHTQSHTNTQTHTHKLHRSADYMFGTTRWEHPQSQLFSDYLGILCINCKDNQEITNLDLEDVLSLFSVFSKKIIKNGWKDMILAFPSCVPGSCSLPFPLTGWEWAVFPLRPLKRAAWKQSQAGHSCRFIVAAWLIDLLMNRRKKKKAFNVRVS